MVGVQVAGIFNLVAVAVGIMTVGISVGGGKKLKAELGLLNILRITAATPQVANKPSIDNTSQSRFFIFTHTKPFISFKFTITGIFKGSTSFCNYGNVSVTVAVSVSVAVGVPVSVGVKVSDGTGVNVRVSVRVLVYVRVGVLVTVRVRVTVCVGVLVGKR